MDWSALLNKSDSLYGKLHNTHVEFFDLWKKYPIYLEMVFMMRIVLAILFICLCFKWGDRKNWKLFYPTVLFYIISNLSYDILTYSKPLWLYSGSFWNHTFADYFVAFFTYPAIIILFLSNFPKKILRQVLYIVFWVFIMSFVEYIMHINGGIKYYNGWSIGWSILFDSIMFSLLFLNYKKPLLSWIISIVLAFSLMFIFNIAFSSLR